MQNNTGISRIYTGTRSHGPRLVVNAICGLTACALLFWSAPGLSQEHGEAGHGHEHGGAGHGHEHGAGGSHDDAHGDDAHGGGDHGGMAPINWFSFNYGHGARKDGTTYKYANPPLGFGIINFAILIILLVKFTRKPISTYLVNRADEVEKALKEAAELRDAAHKKLAEIEARLSDLDGEVQKIKDNVKKDAEEEKVRIIKAAEAESERVIKNAETALQREVRRAQCELEAQAVEQAMRAAEELITKNINAVDKKRLNEEFIAQIAS